MIALALRGRRIVLSLIALLLLGSISSAGAYRHQIYEWFATEVRVIRKGEITERARVWRWGERKGQRHGLCLLLVDDEKKPRAIGRYRNDKTHGEWTLANQEGRPYWVERHADGSVESVERVYRRDDAEWPVANELLRPTFEWRYVVHDALADDPEVVESWQDHSGLEGYAPPDVIGASTTFVVTLDVESRELVLEPSRRLEVPLKVLEFQRDSCPRPEEMQWRRRRGGPTRQDLFRITRTIAPLELPFFSHQKGYIRHLGEKPRFTVDERGVITVRRLVAHHHKEKHNVLAGARVRLRDAVEVEPLPFVHEPRKGTPWVEPPTAVPVPEWGATLHVTRSVRMCVCGHYRCALRLVGDDGEVWWVRHDVAFSNATWFEPTDIDGDGETEVVILVDCHGKLRLHLLERVTSS